MEKKVKITLKIVQNYKNDRSSCFHCYKDKDTTKLLIIEDINFEFKNCVNKYGSSELIGIVDKSKKALRYYNDYCFCSKRCAIQSFEEIFILKTGKFIN